MAWSTAPTATDVTECDQKHIATNPRLLDADAEGVDWAEAARD
jgi:hypothetical protein